MTAGRLRLTPDRTLGVALAASLCVLIGASQGNNSSFGDEGYHLLASRLIVEGDRPYRDFAYQQTPLAVYWNALVMQIGGIGWRPVHLSGAIFAWLTVFGAAWLARAAGVRAALLACGVCSANALLLRFGPLGMPLGPASALIMAAAATISRPSLSRAFLAGFLFAASAACILLAAPALLAGGVWLLLDPVVPRRDRLRLLGAYSAGATTLALLLLPLLRGPHLWMDLFGFQIASRSPDRWAVNGLHLLALARQPQLMLLLAAMAASLWWARRRFPPETRLAAGLAVALAGLAFCIPQTHPHYFLPAVGPAAVVIASSLHGPGVRSLHPAARLVLLLYLALGVRATIRLFDTREGWAAVERAVARLQMVLPPGAALYTDPEVWAVSPFLPPRGLEQPYWTVPGFPLDRESVQSGHVVPGTELERAIRAGAFHAICLLPDHPYLSDPSIAGQYRQRESLAGQELLWGLQDPGSALPVRQPGAPRARLPRSTRP